MAKIIPFKQESRNLTPFEIEYQIFCERRLHERKRQKMETEANASLFRFTLWVIGATVAAVVGCFWLMIVSLP
jgi:hypothetical protein